MTVTDLSRRERQLMKILIRRGRATVAEVLEELEDPPSYDSVRTTLRILERKGHVRHRRDGQRYLYEPAMSKERALREELGELTRTFFRGSFDAAALALLRLSESEASEEALRRIEEGLLEAEPNEEVER